ncbi:MAG: hypothetical protein KatS3mg064_0619 [Tepidiforma sp.]|nr:hypothetical protein [Tepidiforma sp.]GIW17462.1 MAG: hypothetical protein KatS3mg064_0619 [Tepidiforma sp.]
MRRPRAVDAVLAAAVASRLIVTPDVTLDAMAARFFEHPGTVEMIDTGTPSEGREAAKENRL